MANKFNALCEWVRDVRSRQGTDFSVVLFRSDFVLFSEKNHMKVPKNQWVWIMPYHPERLSGATSRGQITAPEVQKPSQ
jgi:hypothetical protein